MQTVVVADLRGGTTLKGYPNRGHSSVNYPSLWAPLNAATVLSLLVRAVDAPSIRWFTVLTYVTLNMKYLQHPDFNPRDE